MSFLIDILEALFTGEIKRWWTEYLANRKAKDIANAPITKPELVNDLEHNGL